MIKNICIGLHVKYPLFLPDFDKSWIFPNGFSKNTQISNFMKFRPLRAELFQTYGRTEGRTDMTKLAVAFRNFANAPKRSQVLSF